MPMPVLFEGYDINEVIAVLEKAAKNPIPNIQAMTWHNIRCASDFWIERIKLYPPFFYAN